MFCTAYITAYYLKHVLQLSGKVYLMGMPGFAHELDLLGVTYTGTGVGMGSLGARPSKNRKGGSGTSAGVEVYTAEC